VNGLQLVMYDPLFELFDALGDAEVGLADLLAEEYAVELLCITYRLDTDTAQ
jgi:hypothetical protein